MGLYWENNSNGICEDAPCCGCCGPQGDGQFDSDYDEPYDPYDDDQEEGRDMKHYIVRLSQPRKKDLPKEVVFESEKLEHYPEEKQYNKYEGWYLLDGQTKEQALSGTRSLADGIYAA